MSKTWWTAVIYKIFCCKQNGKYSVRTQIESGNLHMKWFISSVQTNWFTRMNLTYSANILYERMNRLKELVWFQLFVQVEKVVLVSYIIYLHCASLNYYFSTKFHIGTATVASVTSFSWLTVLGRRRRSREARADAEAVPREWRSLDPAACAANSTQACLTGTGTWRCDIAHFIQRTHTRERKHSWSALKGQVFCNDAQVASIGDRCLL